MITDEALRHFDQTTQDSIKTALATLHVTGVIKVQIKQLSENLLVGSDTEQPKVLAKRILEHRAKVNQLSELDSVGESYYEEMNHNA